MARSAGVDDARGVETVTPRSGVIRDLMSAKRCRAYARPM
jgi:hypothetical protein